MKNTHISLKGEVESRATAGDLLDAPGDAVLVTRGKPRWLLLRCPCGCGEDIPVNLDARAGKAWRLYRGLSNGLTLYPSVWRDTGCQSHFVVWRDRILLFGRDYTFGESPREKLDLPGLAKRVLDAWPAAGMTSYVEVADILREIPWDVLEACRELTKRGILVEGKHEHQGSFRRVSPLR